MQKVTLHAQLLSFVKHCLGFSLCIFSFFTYVKTPVFSKPDLLRWKVPARLYWGLLTSGRYPASLSLFLKCEKIPALLYIGKGPEYRPFLDFRAEISNHKMACTQALLLYERTTQLDVVADFARGAGSV
jgi:hypothetical protein